MRWEAIASALVVALLMIDVAAAAADDRQENTKHEAQLQREARQLDADAGRASNTPDGQRRVTERIANQFNVQPSVVTDLRNRKLGFGGATIALALSQELMKRDPTLTQQAALERIVAERQAGKGWGVIAHDLGLKLGPVVSEVKKAGKPDKVARAEKGEKAEKPDKPARPEKVDKIDKIEKPARAEKPGR